MYDESVKVTRPPTKQANNIHDIEGARPANKHRAKDRGHGQGLKGDDIAGAKPALKQYSYQRKEARNPLDPVKETAVAEYDAPILGGPRAKAPPPKAYDGTRDSQIKKMGFGGRMRDTLDCTDAYQAKHKSQKNLYQPKGDIEGAQPRKLHQGKTASGEFSGLNVAGIEGATPKRFHGKRPLLANSGFSTEGVAGARPSAPASLATYGPHKSVSASTLVFGGDKPTQPTTPQRRNPVLGPANPARYSSGGMQGVLGGSDYGARSRHQPLNSASGNTGSSSKTFQSSGVANSIFHS